MKISIIIPAFNESKTIKKTLLSLVEQTLKADEIIVVDDNSDDNTSDIVSEFIQNFDYITLIQKKSKPEHQPGSKVITAFNEGLKHIDKNTDIIAKFDADLIFPNNYLETIVDEFKNKPNAGMVGGFAYIYKDNQWVIENLTNKDHIRGALKAYRNKTFKQIGGLKPIMGWDTIDELLCQYYGWAVVTLEDQKVKHLRPTGAKYNKTQLQNQGKAFYQIGYGFWLTLIASLKLALKKKKIGYFFYYILGYAKAYASKTPLVVDSHQKKFIRQLRWQNIKNKLTLKM